ncbi:hypothetical protein WJX75_005680 [Coccomyxa subellipsoidea]|uniref:S1 motif domain-containing protein n=1 Tax=Coccomyxa subellipsoidea TaxID=248742 RepID=A0ABR2YMR5_9CHLO
MDAGALCFASGTDSSSIARRIVDWKVTEIDEDYLSSRQETTPLSQKASQLTAAALDPNALEQPVIPETAEAASVAPAVSEAATAAPAGGTSSYSAAAGASEDLQIATATAREESDAEELVKPALSPPLQRAAAPDANPPALQAPTRRGADGTAAWQRGYDLATAALATERPLAGVVVSGSSGGVLVRVRAGFQGFLPFSKMLLQRQIALRERERAAQAAVDPPQGLPVQQEADAQLQEARLQLRRDVMAGLQGQRVMVYVHDVKRAEGEMFYKVFLSEKGPKSEPNPDVPPYLAEALERKVGERVSATVGKLVDYGALLRFEVEVDADYMCEVWGLLHHSKMGRLVLESLQEGEHLEAYVLSAMNGRAELSVEPSQRMNVNQTLEDLLMGDPTAEEGQEGSDEAIESMPEALEVCRELMLSGAISEATPGRRLQGRAFSPEIQVFMARDEGEVAGNGAGAESRPKRYTLLARARNEVQEIEVESDLEREEMKRALGLALSVVLGVM